KLFELCIFGERISGQQLFGACRVEARDAEVMYILHRGYGGEMGRGEDAVAVCDAGADHVARDRRSLLGVRPAAELVEEPQARRLAVERCHDAADFACERAETGDPDGVR